jgi:tRNA U34 5-methylaminomethyl-2-thiouridine-forming methyltransferase MnmC
MKEFKGNLGIYKIIETEDKTQTVWSEFFDENCHNLSGAYQETIYNYIEGCQLSQLVELHDQVNVFDVGFGIGVGLLSIDEFLKVHPNKTINYYSIELDEELVIWAIKNNLNNVTHVVSNEDGIRKILFKLNNISVCIFIGDGRITVLEAKKLNLISPLHAIFQDPFSPKKNPTLWTVEWFTLLKELSHPEVYLSTYSSSVSIRKSLLVAGFSIANAKGFGKKKTMTKARLVGTTSDELLLELKRSPTLELHDN